MNKITFKDVDGVKAITLTLHEQPHFDPKYHEKEMATKHGFKYIKERKGTATFQHVIFSIKDGYKFSADLTDAIEFILDTIY